MQINDLFNILHNSLESQNNGKKISLKDMAVSLGISMRTYQDWKLGRAKPQAASTVMKMLVQLEDDEIIRAVRKINRLKD
jgi:DNA-binding transcriptional regulator YiaG